GGGSGGSSGPSPYTDCDRHGTWLLNWMSVNGSSIFGGGLADSHSAEEIAAAESWTQCGLVADPANTAQWLNNPTVPAAEILVTFAEEQLELELPTVATSPVRGGLQLVGVPVWFWVDNFDATSTTAEVPGLAATLTATPVRTRFQITGPGKGGPGGTSETVVCDGAGTKWEPGAGSDAWAGSDCSYAFDWAGTFTVEAIVDWELTWSATNGQTGTLPAVSRTSTFTINIEQAQAVLD
ncbi:MAG: hypothetical protein ABI239_03045, partial [Aquihabitans sp.]